jgi:hypothetical protein
VNKGHWSSLWYLGVGNLAVSLFSLVPNSRITAAIMGGLFLIFAIAAGMAGDRMEKK